MRRSIFVLLAGLHILLLSSACRQPRGACAGTGDCLDSEVCVSSYCRLRCDDIPKCRFGEACIDDACLPFDTPCSSSKQCLDRQMCHEEKCRILCTSHGDCISGYGCDGAVCLPLDSLPPDAGSQDTVSSDRWFADGTADTANLADSSRQDGHHPDHRLLDDRTAVDNAGPDRASPDRAAPDRAAPDSAPNDACAPCNGVTFFGDCQNQTVRWCTDNCLYTTDCTSFDSPLHCGLFSAEWGYDCLAGLGQVCDPSYPEETASLRVQMLPACDPAIGQCSSHTNTCVSNAGTPCTACGQVTETGTCTNATKVSWCNAAGCLVSLDCADPFIGRHCSTTQNGQWHDCMGSVGQSCSSTYLQGNPVNWMCDPLVTTRCSPESICE